MTQKLPPTQWQAIIEQWQASSLSAKTFCQQQQVMYHNFLYWRRKLRQSVSSQLVPVVPDSSTSVADTIELALPDGLVIRGIHSGNLTLAIELLGQL